MTRLLVLTFLIPFFTLLSTAQNPGCDGIRYKDDVFPAVKMTTVTYAPSTTVLGGAVHLLMDVYEPEGDAVTERPVVVVAHGGSFLFGDRTMMAQYCELLAKKGYVAATIQYRLFPFFPLGFPDSLEIFDTAVKAVGDMRAAVRYFREDAATANQFKIDPDHIFIGGYSAGSVAALHYAYLDMDDEIPSFLQSIINNNGGLEGISGTTTNKTYSSEVKAVVNMSGGLYRHGWIDPTELPLVSIHGTADETVPFEYGLAANIAYLEGSSRLHVQANEVGLWNSLHVVPGGGHTNIYDNAAYKPHLDTFWINATNMLETITCSTVGTNVPWTWVDNWSIAPNPGVQGGVAAIRLPEEVQEAVIYVYDIAGKTVLKNVVSQTNNQVRLTGLTSGYYLVEPVDPTNPEKRFAAKQLIVR